MARSKDMTDSEKILKEVPVDKPPHQGYSSMANSRGWLIGLAGLVVLLVVFAAGMHWQDRHRQQPGMFRTGAAIGGPGIRSEFGNRRGGLFGRESGSNVTINGQSRLEGVVTVVNGNSFTVAGHGSTTNVTTNGSTQYRGGNSVKQNDSVLVSGTSSNGTITATHVVINP